MSTNSNQQNAGNQNDALISYYQLRMFIGLLGFFLSFMLFLTTFLLNDKVPFKVSISHYYYSFGHIIFVGTLCVMGGLFGTYRGKEKNENRVSNICGVLAVLVAAFPTRFKGYEGDIYLKINELYYTTWFTWVHYASACILFILFAVFCLNFFQNSDKEQDGKQLSLEEKKKKMKRNAYYKFCGYGILVSVACIGGIAVLEHYNEVLVSSNLFLKYSTLIFETTSLFFFSTSWLLKSSDFWSEKIPLVSFFR